VTCYVLTLRRNAKFNDFLNVMFFPPLVPCNRKSAYRDQHSRLALALETSAATGARLRAAAEESAARCEEAEARATALGDEFGGRLAELRDALTREAASAASAEAARAAASEDRAKLKHAARQAEDAREGLAKRLGLELNRTKRLEAKVAALEEEVAQKSSAELERETLKGKLRSATVSSKELGKELTMLRHKHEATVGANLCPCADMLVEVDDLFSCLFSTLSLPSLCANFYVLNLPVERARRPGRSLGRVFISFPRTSTGGHGSPARLEAARKQLRGRATSAARRQTGGEGGRRPPSFRSRASEARPRGASRSGQSVVLRHAYSSCR